MTLLFRERWGEKWIGFSAPDYASADAQGVRDCRVMDDLARFGRGRNGARSGSRYDGGSDLVI